MWATGISRNTPPGRCSSTTPAYGGSHFALAMVARQRGDLELARTEAAAARNYWRDADRDLKALAELRPLLVANAGRSAASLR